MQKLILLVLSVCLISISSADQPIVSGDHINWMNLQEAADKWQTVKKPILIDLYTSWCGWCKVMDKKTYSNKQVTQYVEDKFYPVRLDAESKEAIEWKGKLYHFNPGYRSNEFAVYLTQGRLEFPTTVIIPSDDGEPQAIPGYLEPKDFELIAKYFGEGHFGHTSFAEFQRNFKSSW